MTQETEQVQEVDRPANCTSPEVGPGSPEGKRWFVSYSMNHQIVVRAHGGFDEATGMPLNRKGKTINFLSKFKPRHLWGRGFAGDRNQGEGDRNLGPRWGVYATDKKDEIDFLRTRESYQTTIQDNTLETNPRPNLKEFSFDPTPKEGQDAGEVRARSSKPENRPSPTEGAPADDHPSDPTAVKPGLRAPGKRAPKF